MITEAEKGYFRLENGGISVFAPWLEPETPEAEMHLPDLGLGLVPPPCLEFQWWLSVTRIKNTLWGNVISVSFKIFDELRPAKIAERQVLDCSKVFGPTQNNHRS